MVSRVPHLGEDSTNLSQGIGPQAQTQIRDGKGQGQGHGTPRQPKKEAGTPKPAQDVAELKDYVSPFTNLDLSCARDKG